LSATLTIDYSESGRPNDVRFFLISSVMRYRWGPMASAPVAEHVGQFPDEPFTVTLEIAGVSTDYIEIDPQMTCQSITWNSLHVPDDAGMWRQPEELTYESGPPVQTPEVELHARLLRLTHG